MWVQCVDEQYYLEPVVSIAGKEDVYASFIDVPRLIAVRKKDLVGKSIGLVAKVDRKTEMKSTEAFPPLWNSAKLAWSAEFQLLSPIPVPIASKAVSSMLGDDEAIVFSYKFPADVIRSLLRGKSKSRLLERFVGSKAKLLAKLKKMGLNWKDLPDHVELSI